MEKTEMMEEEEITKYFPLLQSDTITVYEFYEKMFARYKARKDAMENGQFMDKDEAMKYFPILQNNTISVYEFCEKHKLALNDYCKNVYSVLFDKISASIEQEFSKLQIQPDENFDFLKDSKFSSLYKTFQEKYFESIQENSCDLVSDTACRFHIILAIHIHDIFCKKNFYATFKKEYQEKIENVFVFLKKNPILYYFENKLKSVK